MKKKRHIVAKIIFSDESFKELQGKLSESDYKKVYDRCFKRFYDRKISKEKIQTFIKDEIRSELFKLIPKVDAEMVTDIQKNELDEEPIKDYIKMKGFDRWQSHPESKIDRIQEITDLFNANTNKYQNETHCKRCFSSPCTCRES